MFVSGTPKVTWSVLPFGGSNCASGTVLQSGLSRLLFCSTRCEIAGFATSTVSRKLDGGTLSILRIRSSGAGAIVNALMNTLKGTVAAELLRPWIRTVPCASATTGKEKRYVELSVGRVEPLNV